eukprot:SAG11_NODE_266_length_11468_cov_11.519222_7_plen_173_part_00
MMVPFTPARSQHYGHRSKVLPVQVSAAALAAKTSKVPDAIATAAAAAKSAMMGGSSSGGDGGGDGGDNGDDDRRGGANTIGDTQAKKPRKRGGRKRNAAERARQVHWGGQSHPQWGGAPLHHAGYPPRGGYPRGLPQGVLYGLAFLTITDSEGCIIPFEANDSSSLAPVANC